MALPRCLREDVWPFFKRCSASDEMFFPTCLALLGEITAAAAASSSEEAGGFASQSVAKRRLTYCRWGDSPKSPESFETLDAGVLAAAVAEGCLFARKFRPGAMEMRESAAAWLAHMRGVGIGTGTGVSQAYSEEGGLAALTISETGDGPAPLLAQEKGNGVEKGEEEGLRKRPRREGEEEGGGGKKRQGSQK